MLASTFSAFLQDPGVLPSGTKHLGVRAGQLRADAGSRAARSRGVKLGRPSTAKRHEKRSPGWSGKDWVCAIARPLKTPLSSAHKRIKRIRYIECTHASSPTGYFKSLWREKRESHSTRNYSRLIPSGLSCHTRDNHSCERIRNWSSRSGQVYAG